MSQVKKQFPVLILAFVLAGALSLSIASATLSPLTPPPTDGYNVGDILDPGCMPTDTDCLINPLSFRGITYGANAVSGHNNEGLYLDGTGNLFSDPNFTRDSSTNHTNITRNFSYSTSTISVDVAPALILDSISGSFNDGDSILNTTDGTSTATIIKSLTGTGGGTVLIIGSISGSFNDGDSILNTTDGTSTAQLVMYNDPFSQGSEWISFDLVNNVQTSSGTIASINGNTYDLGTVLSGTVSQYDLLFNTLNGQPDTVVGVISVSSISTPGSITTGFITDNNYAGFGLQGSYLHQSDGLASIDFGVFDLSSFGASRTSAGIVSIDQNTGASATFVVNPAGSAGSIALGVQSPVGDITNLYLANAGFSLLASLSGGDEYGFGSSGSNAYWRTSSNTYVLPENLPNQNDVLTVSGISGQTVTLDWSAGGGSNPWSAYTIPSDGGNGQVLSTDGSGSLSWIDAGGILPDQTGHDGEFLTTNSGILSWTSNIGSYVPLSYMGANNGVATLDANGKIPSSQLAALAINNSFVAGSEIDMLALAANTGDIAVRTDISSTFVLSGTDPTVLSDWVQLLWQPTVISVNGQTGIVDLTTDDITEGTTNLYFTNSRVNTAITAYLPNQSGNSGRVLSTDGAGNLSWVVQTGGVGGSSPVMLDNNGNLYTGGIGAGQGSAGNIFFGSSAGNAATGASYSNFFSQNAGNGATNAYQSNFFGYESGLDAVGAHDSNFFGHYAGHYATNASYSNFIGSSAGGNATNANYSNFLGSAAGYDATNAANSNFLGANAGYQATNATQSNFFGVSAGSGATNANNSNFLGNAAGYEATGAPYSNFFGYNSGYQATYAASSNFLGNGTGYQATNASSSNFFGPSAGNLATDAYNSNFFGTSAGQVAVNASHSNFFGPNAGQAATNAQYSNFFGLQAGYAATDAHDANFFGNSAGYEASTAEYSNFIGRQAGYQATDAANSNFFGDHAGYAAQNASGSNFFGLNAGIGAISASDSNFFGANAGYGATSAQFSSFFGFSSGFQATNASYSNFFGPTAGYGAIDAVNSNFFGNTAGSQATDAHDSNFFGYYAGVSATDAYSSNFFGYQSGYQATNAYSSNFFGNATGYQAANANNSNFFGDSAGYQASAATNSNFFGYHAGQTATNASYSNFFGENAGYQATSASYSNFFGVSAGVNAASAAQSNFFGYYAGLNATNASYSNFIGNSAGGDATDATASNFFGSGAGYDATNAHHANFIGWSAGFTATDAYDSNFIGRSAGYQAATANWSNFIGLQAGYQATNASNSNFFGTNTGQGATNASNSIFFGAQTGEFATNASNSIFIGVGAGYSDTVDNTGNANDFSILIGKSTSTGGFENSIALGGLATNTASNQFMIGSATRPINEVVIKGSGTCSIVATGISCSSDERLKTNIEDLSGTTLENLLKVRTVLYNWKTDPTAPKVLGFLAQDLEQYYPELVRTDSDGYKMVNYAQMTPILVEAIREMNLNVTGLTDYARPNSWRDAIAAWLGDITNGIQKIFAKEIQTDKLCVGETCVTESQLQQLLQNQNIQATPPSDSVPPSPDPEIISPDGSNPPTVTPDPESDTPAPTDDPAPDQVPSVTDTPPTE